MRVALDDTAAIVGGPFDVILDIGGNVGAWAERAHRAWPQARIYSFEPVAELAAENARRALAAGDGRPAWQTYCLGISDRRTVLMMNVCTSFGEASTLQVPGSYRRKRLGVRDTFTQRPVTVAPLDDLLAYVAGDDLLLVKIDVEGHEGKVIAGGGELLARADCVVCEVNVDETIFYGATAGPQEVHAFLLAHGLEMVGAVGAFTGPDGRVAQLDGVWRRYPGALATWQSIDELTQAIEHAAKPADAGGSSLEAEQQD